MSSVVDRGRRVQRWALEDRRDGRRRRQVEWLYAGLLLSFSLGFFLFGLKAGLYLEPYHVPGEVSGSQVSPVNGSDDDRIRIDGYTFVFESDSSERFNGSTIGQVNYFKPNTIYLQSGLDVEVLYSTCVHEKLHLLRLEEDSEEMHSWIYEHEGIVPDSTCFDLVERRFGSEGVESVRISVEESFESMLAMESGY